MYLEMGKMGIEAITYYDADTVKMGLVDIANVKQHGDMLLPGILIFHGMQLKGPVYLNPTQKTIDKSFVPNGEITTIVLGDYLIMCKEKDIASKLFKLISTIISVPTANKDINESIDIVNELFDFS